MIAVAMVIACRPPVVVDLAAFDGAALDLDGVVTQTASAHSAAWKLMFDAFLAQHAVDRPFDIQSDYARYVDGKPRADGVRDFLASRGIVLPEGTQGDSAADDTVIGLGKRKNALFRTCLATQGVRAFDGSVAFLRRLRMAGIRTALVSSSENAASILAAAGLEALFDARVDGVEAERLALKGKPSPDTFLHAAKLLRVEPARMIGIEDAIAGVKAIRAAGFALAIGIDRAGSGRELVESGADLVVHDLADLTVHERQKPASPAPPPTPLSWTPQADPTWVVREDGPLQTREHEIESVFAIGNGYLGSRGSLAEGSRLSSPATYVAGVFDTGAGASIRLVTLPDWASLSIAIADRPLTLESGRILEHRRILDLERALLLREWRHQDEAARITCIREVRLASASDRHILVQSVLVVPENYSAPVTLDLHTPLTTTQRTTTGITIAFAERSRLTGSGGDAAHAEAIEGVRTLPAQPGSAYRLDRVVAVHTSRDRADPQPAASRHAEGAIECGVAALVDDHVRSWRVRWDACDVKIDGDPALQRALRFALYHLSSAASHDDADVSIGARGLTGAGYQGHVFWDTEIFMLPFFIHTSPATAKALLGYRHRTLPAARRRAAQHGCHGAMYAWESADTGDDVTPSLVVQPNGEPMRILTGAQELHITADVAFAVWQYWNATHDVDFLLDAGIEIVAEAARFWESRVTREPDGLFHITGVIGPDEYHEHVDDNAYTNAMAAWNLETADRLVDIATRRWPKRWAAVSERLRMDPDEPARWRDVARAMYTGLDEHTGLIEQFRGYFELEDLDLAQFEHRNAPMEVLLGRTRLQQSQIVKQADVVMLLHVLWDRFAPHVRQNNYRYYEPRCCHGSSLSPAIHALVAARLGEMGAASRHLQRAMDIDLAPNTGNSASGVHMGALGGLWQAVVFGFGGLQFAEGGPFLEPRLPDHWRGLSFPVAWRGCRHDVSASNRDRPRAGLS